MPGRDGTGPMGAGPMTGRGLGVCTGVNAVRRGAGFGPGLGLGLGCRRGWFGRGFGYGYNVNTDSADTKEALEAQKDLLENRLNVINKQLENL